MKKMMRRLAAALTAMACLPVAGMTASAVDMPWYWGNTTWDVFEGEEPINDHGMLTGENGMLYEKNDHIAILVTPRENAMRFVLRDDVDLETAPMQMAELLDAYIPGIVDGFYEDNYQQGGCWVFALPDDRGRFEQMGYDRDSRVFELWFYKESMPDDLEQLQADILLAFARNHLISGFYGCGATAGYKECWADPNVLEGIREDTVSDWDSVQAYLTELDPAYTLERSESWRETNGDIHYDYRVNGLDALSFREKIELAGELYEKFGLRVDFISPESAGEPQTALGHNALESPGDVTLDCELDILDVIAANKYLLGAETLCDTAKTNADINADGTPDETDSLAILKEVVGITENFEQK